MRRAALLSTLIAAAIGSGGAQAAPSKNPFSLKAGQQLIFSASVADGKVTVGTPRLVKLGAEEPKDGEISVGLTPKDKETFVQYLAAKGPNPDDNTLRELLHLMMSTPEYQLT